MGRAEIVEQMFDPCQCEPVTNQHHPTQPEPAIVRLMRVIADPALHPRRFVAFEVILRAVGIATVAALVLWLLPVIADTAG